MSDGSHLQPRTSFAPHFTARRRKAIEETFRSELSERFVRIDAERTPRTRLRVLQVGLDGGRWIPAMDAGALEFLGIGWDAEDLRVTQSNYPKLELRQLKPDASIPVEPESIDVSVLLLGLQMQPSGMQRQLIADMWGALRPGGWLLLLDEFVPGGLYGHTWPVQDLTSFFDLLILATGGRISLLHMKCLRYPGDPLHRAASMTFAKIGVSRWW